MKILTLDIENTPNLAYVWSLKQSGYIPPSMLAEASQILCVAWKWYGEDDVYFATYDELDRVWSAIDAADAVVTYNGDKHDLPRLNSAFIELGFDVPSPYHSIDLYKTVRRVFGWQSNKLDYVAQRLQLGHKVQHDGFSLWLEVMKDNPIAWDSMEEYNKGDVVLTEKLYTKLLPWIKTHPNFRLYSNIEGCPKCGSDRIQRRGTVSVQTSVYQQYKCMKCGGWFRDTKRIEGSSVR